MKNLTLVALTLALLNFGQAHSQTIPNSDQAAIGANTLSIQVQGVQTRTGQIMLSLCTEAEYDATNRCAFGAIVPIREIGRPIVINNVPNGIYGVKVFHDVNGNGRMDTNAMGIPREPFAFSNNARGRFGPAKFADASFTIDKATSITIRLN
jgi:uncharacterized protein (DUF2141 family)